LKAIKLLCVLCVFAVSLVFYGWMLEK